ncbi:MAG: 30S ribosomal protein S1 [Bradymonadaceae bacterium]|nr:30S ribosomal protein S1 [Lujinxingiaceae bacterium]
MADKAASQTHDSKAPDTLENRVVEATFAREDATRLSFELPSGDTAFVARDEFGATLPFEQGAKVRVLVENPLSDGWNGSVQKAEKLDVWDKLEELVKSGEAIRGIILNENKGGMSVDIGLRAFMPMSQVDLHRVNDTSPYIGRQDKFQVIKFDKEKADVVVSRRNLLEKGRDSDRQEALGELTAGQQFEGVVRNITNFGAFVDIGGIDGLLHVSNMSWGRVDHPSELVRPGDKLQVVVLEYDKKKKRLSLGRKQLLDDPWTELGQTVSEGDRINGKVVSLADFGAFIEIQPGLEGLVHVTELAWTGRINHPKDVLDINQQVDVKVLSIDTENRRLSLSIKQLEESPWAKLTDQFPSGSRVEGTIRNITDFGLFVEIAPSIEGLVHVSDLSWTEKIEDPRAHYKVGETVEVVVLDIDVEAERAALGIKQLVDDPWQRAADIAKPGQKIDVTIARITDFGAFATIVEGVEGLIHISELREERVEKVSEVARPGQVHKALVLTFDRAAQRISLSLKRDTLGDDEGAREYNDNDGATATLGDILRDRLGIQSSEELAAGDEPSAD